MFAPLTRLLRRDTFSLKYIPEVDGLRFLAIVMVLLHHSFNIFSMFWQGDPPVSSPITDVIITNGFKGIHLFFVLSGFILALPFIKWRNGTAPKINVRRYFVRRLIRLEPPYIIALLLCFGLELYHGIGPGRFGHFVAALFYLHNIVYERAGNINSVAWTLEIETQFYLFAPLLFQVFRLAKRRRRCLLLILTIAFNIVHNIYLPDTLTLYNYISYFLLGALIADFYADGKLAALNSWWAIVIALVLFVLLWWVPISQGNHANFLFPFIVAAFIFIVFNNDALRRIFSARMLTIIGGMCYSIYLLHYTIMYMIAGMSRLLFTGISYWENVLIQFPIYITGVLFICMIYFVLVEKPFMALSAKRKNALT